MIDCALVYLGFFSRVIPFPSRNAAQLDVSDRDQVFMLAGLTAVINYIQMPSPFKSMSSYTVLIYLVWILTLATYASLSLAVASALRGLESSDTFLYSVSVSLPSSCSGLFGVPWSLTLVAAALLVSWSNLSLACAAWRAPVLRAWPSFSVSTMSSGTRYYHSCERDLASKTLWKVIAVVQTRHPWLPSPSCSISVLPRVLFVHAHLFWSEECAVSVGWVVVCVSAVWFSSLPYGSLTRIVWLRTGGSGGPCRPFQVDIPNWFVLGPLVGVSGPRSQKMLTDSASALLACWETFSRPNRIAPFCSAAGFQRGGTVVH